MRAAVITCSNRSAAGARADDSGALLEDALRGLGHDVIARVIVPDQVDAIRRAVRQAIEDDVAVVLTTGGTGLNPSDVTPEAVGPMLEREIPGIAESLRLVAREKVPTSVLSRGVAGTIGTTLVVTLPGSPGGAKDGISVLGPLLDHIADQLRGGDHRPGGGVAASELASEPGIGHRRSLSDDEGRP